MQELSDYQRRVLLKNPNVQKITDKHVIYKSTFKIKAVEGYINGLTANEVFESAGIDPRYFISDYCHSCIKRWKKNIRKKVKIP